jgi:hypothetical protein
VQDAGEPGIANVRLTLDSASGTQAVAYTDANGYYLFTNVIPGTYHVDVDESTLPAGYQFTKPNVGNDSTDSDVETRGGTAKGAGFAALASRRPVALGPP